MHKFIFISLLCSLVSCSPYQKALKSTDMALKVKMAEKFYKEKDYKRAIMLYDQAYSKYIGKPQGERVLYMYGMSLYNPDSENGSYYLSAEIFNTFLEYYPNSTKVSEALFFEAKSHYKLSPYYERDQSETIKAKELLQDYINNYVDGEKFQEANKIMRALTNKMEKKAFEIAKHYGTIEDHKSCVRALELFSLDYPGSIYSEETYYDMLKSMYVIATNSVRGKEEERLEKTIKIYNTLMRKFPNTKYKKEAKKIFESTQKHLEKDTNNKTTTS